MTTKNIVSPVPGVFYRKPSPTEDDFVTEGQPVKSSDTIGLVEVMKNYYDVKAETDGSVVEFLAENEEFVEAGQILAILKTE